VTAATIIEVIRDLVAFDTTSREPNRALIEYVRDRLAVIGVASDLIWDQAGRKANLWATIGPDDRPGVVLSGHTDVVPVDGQAWSSDPFVLREGDGRLYGRGTADMKSFIATALALAPEMARRKLATPIHFAFSHDEEIGCVGVKSLIDRLRRRKVKPALCIVGEPTEMQVVVGHKGGRSYRVTVRGREAHSSLAPQAVNAVEYAAELIAHLAEMARRMAADGPHDHGFDIPCTTLQTGLVRGGTAINIVPKDCEFVFEFRHLPEVDPDAVFTAVETYAREVLEPRMRSVATDSAIKFEPVYAYPGLAIEPGHPAVTLVKSLVGRNDHGKVAFGTEGGLFQGEVGIPTVICGPGSIREAHKPDEFIALDQIGRCEMFLRRLIDRLEAGPAL
jgi:acetylornithine deacetylase